MWFLVDEQKSRSIGQTIAIPADENRNDTKKKKKKKTRRDRMLFAQHGIAMMMKSE